MIEDKVLDEILAFAETEGGEAECIKGLRKQWPGLHFTHCFEDELCLEEPVREGEKANLYVVGGSEHCLKITKYPESATGVLVAELSE